MVAIGGLGVVYLVVQTLVAGFVYRESAYHNRRSPVVLGVAAFVLSVAATIAVGNLLTVLAAQALAFAIYLLTRSEGQASPN